MHLRNKVNALCIDKLVSKRESDFYFAVLQSLQATLQDRSRVLLWCCFQAQYAYFYVLSGPNPCNFAIQSYKTGKVRPTNWCISEWCQFRVVCRYTFVCCDTVSSTWYTLGCSSLGIPACYHLFSQRQNVYAFLLLAQHHPCLMLTWVSPPAALRRVARPCSCFASCRLP